MRHGEHSQTTRFSSPGSLQCNFVALDAGEANSLLSFMLANPQCAPVIATGTRFSLSPHVAAGFDAALDLPMFTILHADGTSFDTPDVTRYWEEDKSLMCIAFGCSFSMEYLLACSGFCAAGSNVAMFITSMQMNSVAHFSGAVVVSLRIIPTEQVQQLYTTAASYPLAHGAPLYAGDPNELGIISLAQPDYGDPPSEGELAAVTDGTHTPVFFACGVSVLHALHSCARTHPIIMHKPGHMLLLDVPLARARNAYSSGLPVPRSPGTLETLCTQQSRRGMHELQQRNDSEAFFHAAQLLANRWLTDCRSAIVIVTGFVIIDHELPETDGIPGAVMLANALVRLGFSNILVVSDPQSNAVLRSLLAHKSLLAEVECIDCRVGNTVPDGEHSFVSSLLQERQPVAAISIEHPGKDADGVLRDMKGQDVTSVNALLDSLFSQMQAGSTIAIGDGGNEIGFGMLAKHIPSANPTTLPTSPCITPCAHLLLGWTSNFASIALIASLSKLFGQDVTPSKEENEQLVQLAVQHGALDGVTKEAMPSVDALSISEQRSWLNELHSLPWYQF